MRPARIHLERRALDELRGKRPRIGERYDLVIVAVQDKRGDLDRLQVLGEVGLRECLDAVVVRLRTSHHSLAPPVVDQTLRNLRAGTVEAVERARWQVDIKLRAVGSKRYAQPVERLDGRTTGVLVRLDHD